VIGERVVIDVAERLQLRSIVPTRCAAIPLSNVANGSNPCENAREQRMRRIVFSLFFFRLRLPVLFFSYST
jgi:hypothetical protein